MTSQTLRAFVEQLMRDTPIGAMWDTTEIAEEANAAGVLVPRNTYLCGIAINDICILLQNEGKPIALVSYHLWKRTLKGKETSS